MRQQHAQCDLIATRVLSGELADNRNHGHLQIKQTALVEDHGHRRSGDRLCNRGEIKESVNCKRWAGDVVRKSTERAQGDEFACVRNGDGSRRERTGSDRLFENLEGGAETAILFVVSGTRKRCEMGNGAGQIRILACSWAFPVYSKECNAGKAIGQWRRWHLWVADSLGKARALV